MTLMYVCADVICHYVAVVPNLCARLVLAPPLDVNLILAFVLNLTPGWSRLMALWRSPNPGATTRPNKAICYIA